MRLKFEFWCFGILGPVLTVLDKMRVDVFSFGFGLGLGLGLILLSCSQQLSVEAYGKFDLPPEDLKALCKVVSPGSGDVSPSKCIYYKWVSCDKDTGDSSRPCGWFQQTECPKSKKKRSALLDLDRHNAMRQGSRGGLGMGSEAGIMPTTYLSWPERK